DDLQALRLGTLGDQLADLAGLGGLVRVRGPQVRFQGGGGDQGGAGGVVDHLGDHVPGGPVDHEAGPRSRPGDPLAHPEVTAGARRALARSLDGDSHGYLPAFPTLRRTCSSAYRTPLPLYGSGRRILRMLAATSPTCCLSMPETENLVGDSTANVMPSGADTVTGWENPSANSRLDRKSTRLNSSHVSISYAVFCLKKKK